MRKEGAAKKTFFLIVISTILAVSLISIGTSGWLDELRASITGRATSQNFNLNVSVGNTPPNITSVEISSSYSATEETITSITFYFIANDTDGWQNLNDATAAANFTFYNATGMVNKAENGSCVAGNHPDTKTTNYSCTLNMWYFYPSGTNAWNVTAYIADTSAATGQNGTVKFTYNSLQAFKFHPGNMTFASLSPGDTNKTPSNNPLVLNNTGNYHYAVTTLNVSVNATNLVGETNSAYSLYANNFTAGTYGSGSDTVNCGNATWSQFMTKAEFVNMTRTNVTLPYGNLSVGGGSAQMRFNICLTKVGNEITSQAYSTAGPNSNGPWKVRVG